MRVDHTAQDVKHVSVLLVAFLLAPFLRLSLLLAFSWCWLRGKHKQEVEIRNITSRGRIIVF